MKVYKLLSADEWDAAKAAGRFNGSSLDLRDGFIHLSTAVQAPETARRHFAGERRLVLLRIDAATLGAALKWEPSRGGDLFPHLYGPIDYGLVEAATEVALDADATPLLDPLAP